MAYITFNHVVKEYPSGSSVVRALDDASFTAERGKLTVILGASGAGKTTALNILGGMDTATSGSVTVGDLNITKLNGRGLVKYRREDIGFVFQFYNLVPNLTALENVELASQICSDHFDPAQTLIDVGLEKDLIISQHNFLEANSSEFLLRAHLPKSLSCFYAMSLRVR